MGIVTQEAILFNDTVHNNIAFGMEGVTEEDVISAAKIANAHELLSRWTKGIRLILEIEVQNCLEGKDKDSR